MSLLNGKTRKNGRDRGKGCDKEKVREKIEEVLRALEELDIVEVRQALGLSQEKLAQRLDVSYRTIARWEYNKSRPNDAALREMKNLLDTESARSLSQ